MILEFHAKRILPIVICVFLFESLATAQAPLSPAKASVFNLAVGYEYLHADAAPSRRIAMQGIDASITADFLPRLGVRLDVGYARATNLFGSGHTGDILNYFAGPVFYPIRHRRLSTYVDGLIGFARVTGAIPATAYPFLVGGFSNKFGWAAGGGIDYRFDTSWSLRTGAEYMHTSYFDQSALPRGQSNVRVVCSIVYLFGNHRPRRH